MTTVTVELDDSVYAALEAEAREQQTTVSRVLADLATLKTVADAEAGEASAMARRHLQKYPSLFKRLAE